MPHQGVWAFPEDSEDPLMSLRSRVILTTVSPQHRKVIVLARRGWVGWCKTKNGGQLVSHVNNPRKTWSLPGLRQRWDAAKF